MAKEGEENHLYDGNLIWIQIEKIKLQNCDLKAISCNFWSRKKNDTFLCENKFSCSKT